MGSVVDIKVSAFCYLQAEAVCEEYAGRLAAMEQRCAEVDLLRGENLRQGDALADLHQRLRSAEVTFRISHSCFLNFVSLQSAQLQLICIIRKRLLIPSKHLGKCTSQLILWSMRS